jgi:acetylornithine deacetylase/succinyl-diaminopimelate desuccinylase-like protein
MHTPNEMVELADLERSAQLLAAFTRKITEKTDFTPN